MLSVDDQVARLKKINDSEKLNMLKVSRFITADEWVEKFQKRTEAKAEAEAAKVSENWPRLRRRLRKEQGG
jgi:hypothetical protein